MKKSWLFFCFLILPFYVKALEIKILSPVKLSNAVLSESIVSSSEYKIDDKDSGEMNEEGFLCDQSIVYTTHLKAGYEKPKVTFGDHDDIYIKLKLENIHIDALLTYKSSWTLCDTVAAEVEMNVDSVSLDLIILPFENDDGEWEYGVKFENVSLSGISLSYPDVADFVVDWMNSYVRSELQSLLKSDFGKKFKKSIERKIKEILG